MHNFLKVAAFSSVFVMAGYGSYGFASEEVIKPTKVVAKKGKSSSGVPDFKSFVDVNEKKQAFFSYLKPGVALENKRIEKERTRLTRIKTNFDAGKVTSSDLDDAKRLAQFYSVELTDNKVSAEWLDDMLHRVDVIPQALVLTQAANESAWGTSRFATTANNYFGQWCYSKGCGVVPLHRNEGMTHEVAKFNSVQESIHRYFMNVNRNRAYKELRQIRFELRSKGTDLLGVDSAMELSNGLFRYSERGEAYVNDLKAMMRHNKKYWIE